MLVTNSSCAPPAASHSAYATLTPTTHSGGTSEIEIATPGSESAISSRLMQKAPAAPEASAAIRSTTRGWIRPVIWLLLSNESTPV
jgi:hypothetical protein